MGVPPASVNEKIPSLAKMPFVKRVHEANGVDRSVAAQSRKGLADGPLAVREIFPFGIFWIPVKRGVRTMRKIVPPPPAPPWLVDP